MYGGAARGFHACSPSAWEAERFRLFLALTGTVLSSSAHGAAVLYSFQTVMEMACFGYAVTLIILSISFRVLRFSVWLIPFALSRLRLFDSAGRADWIPTAR
jgi:hypothetical protein